MTSPFAGGGFTLPSGVTLTPEMMERYITFWNTAQEGEESRFGRGIEQQNLDRAYKYAALNETREDRQARLTASMAQIDADRERNAILKGQAEADAQYKRDVIALQRAELGAGLLKTATDLFGKPGSWARAFNFARGVSGDQALAEPLRALTQGYSMPAFGQQTGTAEPLSIGGLADRLLGGGTGASGLLAGGSGAASGTAAEREYQANVAAAREIGLNPQKLAPGSFESLTGGEQAYLGDALRANTIDPDDWLQRYYNSRPGQGLADSGQA